MSLAYCLIDGKSVLLVFCRLALNDRGLDIKSVSPGSDSNLQVKAQEIVEVERMHKTLKCRGSVMIKITLPKQCSVDRLNIV